MSYIDDAARVTETTNSIGVDPLTLLGAYNSSYRRFAAVCSVGDTVPYTIIADSAGSWEHGKATYTALNELTRTEVYSSSNLGLHVNFAAGTKVVFLGNAGMVKSILAGLQKEVPDDNDVLGGVDSDTGLVAGFKWSDLKDTLFHDGLAGSGTNTHVQIDTALTRLADTSGVNTGDQIADRNFVHSQDVAANTWSISHNLGKFPSVTIVDSTGAEVDGETSHSSVNQLVIGFSAIFSGKAYLN